MGASKRATGGLTTLVMRVRMRKARARVRRSLIAIPAGYLIVAIVLGELVPALDRSSEGPLRFDTGIDTARDILTSTATGMIAFTGLVIASVLVVVQSAASQYSPRLILWFRRDPLVKHAIGSFLAAFIYALVALHVLEGGQHRYSPDLTIAVALILLVGAALLFLALLQRVTDRLRPRALYAAVARDGIAAAHAVYPHPLGEAPAHAGDSRAWACAEPVTVRHTGTPGVVTSFDQTLLVAIAVRLDATIELVPAVGEFVDPDAELLRIHGGDRTVAHRLLTSAVGIADERTIAQDPSFAMRLVVDTAIRALSPAINDPTTAVNGVDQLEVIVRELAGRDLDASLALDDDGRVRLVWRSPDWDDLLDLAFDEIREYGTSSVQICRRLRAALLDLRKTTATLRHPHIDAHLTRLDNAVARAYGDGSPDLPLAMIPDRMGIGGLKRPC